MTRHTCPVCGKAWNAATVVTAESGETSEVREEICAECATELGEGEEEASREEPDEITRTTLDALKEEPAARETEPQSE